MDREDDDVVQIENSPAAPGKDPLFTTTTTTSSSSATSTDDASLPSMAATILTTSTASTTATPTTVTEGCSSDVPTKGEGDVVSSMKCSLHEQATTTRAPLERQQVEHQLDDENDEDDEENTGNVMKKIDSIDSLSSTATTTTTSEEAEEEGTKDASKQQQQHDASPSTPTSTSTSTTIVNQIPSPPARPPKRVQFSTVTIAEHPMIVGDNPGGLQGCPVTIAWQPVATTTLSLTDYEATRPPRRDQSQMALPATVRETILRHWGHSREDIRAGLRAANILRAQRSHTRQTAHTGLQLVYESVERVTRHARHVLTLGRIKRQERELLQPYRRNASSTTTAAAAAGKQSMSIRSNSSSSNSTSSGSSNNCRPSQTPTTNQTTRQEVSAV